MKILDKNNLCCVNITDDDALDIVNNFYYIINLTDNKIEAFYEGKLYANTMLRNFSEYYPNKNFILVQTGKQINKRPTNKQLFRILQIEKGCNIPFTGITKEAASKFLDRHIEKTKQFDKEIEMLKQ